MMTLNTGNGTCPHRLSVKQNELESYWDCGWQYLRPDFDHPGYYLIEWLGNSVPRLPVQQAAE